MNYQGSRKSMLRFIQDTIKKYTKDKYNNITDLFAGSGIISSAYRRQGYNVIANDLELFSSIYNSALISCDKKVDISYARSLNMLPPQKGFIYNNYCLGSGSGRNYFTDTNGQKIDAIREEIEKLYQSKKINIDTYYFYIASLLESVDKVANVAMNYGTFLKKIKQSAAKQFKFQLLPFVSGSKGVVYNKNANELIKSLKGDILYLDPPQNGRQYSTNYHLLNTIAAYDNPELNDDVAGTRKDESESKYSIKKYAAEALEDLIKNADYKYIFLTYNSGCTINIKEFEPIMSKYGEYHLEIRDEKEYLQDKRANGYNYRAKGDECIHILIK